MRTLGRWGLLLALAWAAPAAAEGFGERLSIEARGGVATATHEDLRIFDAGLTLEAAVLYRAHRNLGFALTAGWTDLTTAPVHIGVDPEPDTLVARLVLRERLLPVILEVKGILPLGVAEVYASAAAGVTTSSFSDTIWTRDARRDTSFTWGGGAGGSVRLGDRVSITAGARYLRAGARYADSFAIVLANAVAGMRPRLDHLTVTLGVGFRPGPARD